MARRPTSSVHEGLSVSRPDEGEKLVENHETIDGEAPPPQTFEGNYTLLNYRGEVYSQTDRLRLCRMG